MRGIRHEGGSSEAPRRRDYHRRKNARRSEGHPGRPFWRQPLLLGLIVLLLGSGGAGGWWAWREGWLVEARNRVDAIGLAIVGAVTPFKLVDVTVEGAKAMMSSAAPSWARSASSRRDPRRSASTCRPRASGSNRSTGWPAPPSSAASPTRFTSSWSSAAPSPSGSNGSGGLPLTTRRQRHRCALCRHGRRREKLLLLGGPGAPEHVGELLLFGSPTSLLSPANCARRCGSATAAGTWCSTTASRSGVPEGIETGLPRQACARPRPDKIALARVGSSIYDCRTSSISGNQRPRRCDA